MLLAVLLSSVSYGSRLGGLQGRKSQAEADKTHTPISHVTPVTLPTDRRMRGRRRRQRGRKESEGGGEKGGDRTIAQTLTNSTPISMSDLPRLG